MQEHDQAQPGGVARKHRGRPRRDQSVDQDERALRDADQQRVELMEFGRLGLRPATGDRQLDDRPAARRQPVEDPAVVEVATAAERKQPRATAPRLGRALAVPNPGEGRAVAEAVETRRRPFAEFLEVAFRMMRDRDGGGIGERLSSPSRKNRVRRRWRVESHECPVGVNTSTEQYRAAGHLDVGRHGQAVTRDCVEEPIRHQRARRLLRIHAVARGVQVGRVRRHRIAQERARANECRTVVREHEFRDRARLIRRGRRRDTGNVDLTAARAPDIGDGFAPHKRRPGADQVRDLGDANLDARRRDTRREIDLQRCGVPIENR